MAVAVNIPAGNSAISSNLYMPWINSLKSFTVPDAKVILAGSTITSSPELFKCSSKFSTAIISYSLQINSPSSSARSLAPKIGTAKIRSNFLDVNS